MYSPNIYKSTNVSNLRASTKASTRTSNAKSKSLAMDRLKNISVYDYYKFYIKNSRFLGIIWQGLTICYAICLCIVFVSPNWIGDRSTTRGYFALYSFCYRENPYDTQYTCFGSWTNFSTLPNSNVLKAACALVGIALLLSFVCLIVSIFAVVVKYERIFHICAWIQLLSAICLLVGICIYPISWDLKEVRKVCGREANQFRLGTCTVRWPFILAYLAFGQVFLLTILAFLLAARQAKSILIYASCNSELDTNNRGRAQPERTFFA